jgi:hypothetical protein
MTGKPVTPAGLAAGREARRRVIGALDQWARFEREVRGEAHGPAAAALEQALADMSQEFLELVHPSHVIDYDLAHAVRCTNAARPDTIELSTKGLDMCTCECSSGGFCGGCGHAGCGRRGR